MGRVTRLVAVAVRSLAPGGFLLAATGAVRT
jgi:hypothetical protein